MLILKHLRPISGFVLLISLSSSPYANSLNLELPPQESYDAPRVLQDTTPLGEGGSASAVRSATEERELGRQLVRLIRRERPMIEDAEISDWIRSLANRLVTHSPSRPANLHIVIENNNEMNARALLGGVIVINSGLILNTQSESELAAVIAHEIAHVSQHHLDRMLQENRANPVLMGLAVLAGALAAGQSTDATQAIITGTAALQAHRQILFTHRAEAEADRIGIAMLAAAGFDPSAMPSFLEKLERGPRDAYGDISQYLRTHPLTIDRVSDTRARANQFGNRPTREDRRYPFVREKLRQITQQNYVPPLYRDEPLINDYRPALQAERNDQPQRVLQYITGSNRQLPTDLLRARALINQRSFNEAERFLRPVLQRNPNHEAVQLIIAEAQIGSGRSSQAIPNLLNSPAMTTEGTSVEFFEIAQRLAQHSGHRAEAHWFSAERSIRRGEYQHAKTTLEQGLAQPNTNAQISTRLRNRLLEVERMLVVQKQLGLR